MPSKALDYSPDLETIASDEADVQRELVDTFRGIIETVDRDHGHAFRSVHAKSHALLSGTLTVRSGLPEELAQGLFAKPATYPALVRISTNAGDPLPDTISLPRGLALKVIGVDGERLDDGPEVTTQDFVLANGRAFSASDAKAFLKTLKLLAATTDRAEWGKKAISALFRVTEKAIEAVGGESATLKALGGYPNSHPLGESYFSQVPIRYGRHIAKVAVEPLSPSFKAFSGREIVVGGREDALRQDIVAALAGSGGQWQLCVQLCRDLADNPIEDASVAWSEANNPYLPVATIEIPAQTGWSQARALIVDDEMSFSPWHCLAAHRPLGGIMRARKTAYEQSSALRARLNGCPMHEPAAALDLP